MRNTLLLLAGALLGFALGRLVETPPYAVHESPKGYTLRVDRETGRTWVLLTKGAVTSWHPLPYDALDKDRVGE